jgi:rSAM/selenodomain-associated transferase 1
LNQILVIAKQPIPGQVKTRLCPPYTPDEAAKLAVFALGDTLEVVRATTAVRRVLLLEGSYSAPGFTIVPQRGSGLSERIAHGFVDSMLPGVGSLLIGMDTPQVTQSLLQEASALLDEHDVVLGLAEDGGWWALGLRDPRHGYLLQDVPMSTPDTGRITAAAIRSAGLHVADLPTLRDVDTASDVHAVAALAPGGRFAAAVKGLQAQI